MKTKIERYFISGGAGSYEEIFIDTTNYIISLVRDTVDSTYHARIANSTTKQIKEFGNEEELVEAICDMCDGLPVKDLAEPYFSEMTIDELKEYVHARD